MKPKLVRVHVLKARDIRNPIDWELIERKRNEGLRFIQIVGDINAAFRNPRMQILHALFMPEDVETTVDPSELEAEIVRLKNELKGKNLEIGRLKKKLEKED